MAKTLQDLSYDHINDMASQLKEFVKQHQGEKGYIDLRLNDDDYVNNKTGKYDEIITISYIGAYESPEEVLVKAIRYNKKYDTLEILTEDRCYGSVVVVWTEDNIKNADEDDWEIISNSDVLDYVKTIFNIAEYIEEYITE